MARTHAYIPPWLEPLLGARERAIVEHPQVRVLAVDQDGNRLPQFQRQLETPDGRRMTIDSQRRAIIN